MQGAADQLKVGTQKYKIVVDPNTGARWVKEKNNPADPNCKEATRHAILIGPKGGEYFINNDGKVVYLNTVPNITEVWSQDSLLEAPPEGEAGYGFGNQKQPKH